MINKLIAQAVLLVLRCIPFHANPEQKEILQNLHQLMKTLNQQKEPSE
jgi:hypothetical protein